MRIPFFGKNNSDKPESQQRRTVRLMSELVFRVALLFMCAVAVIYGIVSMILGSSLFIPRSAEGVLESVETPSFYAWTSESVRAVDLAGAKQRQDAVRSAVVDTAANKFQVLVVGVLPERTTYVSDGNYAIRLTESAQSEYAAQGESGPPPWELVTDYCHRTSDPADSEPIPVSTVQMPTAEMFLGADPEIDTDEGTILGERAWVIDFKLTPEILKQLMWLNFFDRAAKANPGEAPWVISKAERQLIEAGEYDVDYAKVWVTRKEPRQIAQIDVRFQIGGGEAPLSDYRFLAQQVPSVNQEADNLNNINLGNPCGGEVPNVPEELSSASEEPASSQEEASITAEEASATTTEEPATAP